MRKNKIANVFFALILVGVGINLGQFLDIEQKQNDNYKALNVSSSGDAIYVGISSSPTLRSYYIPWLALSRVAPDSTVFVPEAGKFDPQNKKTPNDPETLGRLLAYGNIEELIVVPVPEFNVNKAVSQANSCLAASGENARQDLPYFAIMLNQDKCPKLVTTNQPQSGLLISSDVPVKPRTTFLLMPWRGPDEPYYQNKKVVDLETRKANYYALLIETSLLPGSVQKELE